MNFKLRPTSFRLKKAYSLIDLHEAFENTPPLPLPPSQCIPLTTDAKLMDLEETVAENEDLRLLPASHQGASLPSITEVGTAAESDNPPLDPLVDALRRDFPESSPIQSWGLCGNGSVILQGPREARRLAELLSFVALSLAKTGEDASMYVVERADKDAIILVSNMDSTARAIRSAGGVILESEVPTANTTDAPIEVRESSKLLKAKSCASLAYLVGITNHGAVVIAKDLETAAEAVRMATEALLPAADALRLVSEAFEAGAVGPKGGAMSVDLCGIEYVRSLEVIGEPLTQDAVRPEFWKRMWRALGQCVGPQKKKRARRHVSPFYFLGRF